MNRIFISKSGRFVLNLNQLSYMMIDAYGKHVVYVVGDTRPQPIKEEVYNEILAFIKAINSAV